MRSARCCSTPPSTPASPPPTRPTPSPRACSTKTVDPTSAVLRVRVTRVTARVPLGALIAVGRDPAAVLQCPGGMQQIPGHERGVAVGEVVVERARVLVEVARSGPRFADPARVGLRRDRVAEVLQRVEDVHRAVLDPVL